MRTMKTWLATAAILYVAAANAEANVVEVDNLQALADAAAKSGQTIRVKPGVYQMSDYLTPEVLTAIRAEIPANSPGRPPVWMMRLTGDDNVYELAGVTIEIDTALYTKLPRGYTRCLFLSGSRNTVRGLTVRSTGDANRGSHGNIFSIWGAGNTLEDVTLYVSGSFPYGYGDLLGKGNPNLVGLQKQSGLMIAGRDQVVRRCRVISRAFGHCFYVQRPEGMVTDNIRLEDCYAEGVTRTTADMLREEEGPLAKLNFRTIAENRDGRLLVVPGYVKSLVEDGFRTYGGTSRVTLVNCTAINTRAGFELSGPDEGDGRTVLENCTSLGCERAFLIGSRTIVRKGRGDTVNGPLLYLRGGQDSDVEIELVGTGSDHTVHALATIAGENHRVRLFTREPAERRAPSVPIMLGFGMPAHAEMASPIRPAAAKNVHLINELDRFVIVQGDEAVDCKIETSGKILGDDESRSLANRPTSAPATTRAAR